MDKSKLKEACDALVVDIGKLLRGGISDGESSNDAQLRLVESWKVGSLILEMERREGLSDKERGDLLKMLSAALNKRDTKRFGRRNVFYMRKFAREYGKPTGNEKLSWSHYRVLLTVEDEALRRALAERGVKEGLSVREFENAVLETVGFESVTDAAMDRVLSVASARRLGMYKVVQGTDGTLLLDGGFGIWLNVAPGALDGMGAGTYVQRAGTSKEAYVVMPEGKGYRYAYEAYVLRVVDGDTLLLEVVLGAQARGRLRLRLRGVNAMEAGTALGVRASRFVRRRLKEGKQVLVHTYGNDRYGRYVADLFYCKDGECSSPEEGIHLNREMVNRKVAQLRK